MALSTKDETLRSITETYLRSLDINNPPTPATIQSDLLEQTAIAYQQANNQLDKGQKWKIPDKLVPAQIADILLTLYPIANIACAGVGADHEYDLLAIYQTTGKNEGIYVTDEQTLHQLARNYCYTLSSRDTQEVIHLLKDRAPRMHRCENPNFIAVNNGIFNYETKTLQEFTPNQVFLAKSKINYNPNATNIIIHNDEDGTDWDIESWMEELFEDTDVRETVWQILGAIIRPGVTWNKSAWFYSTTGNNGKGTLCELMRQLSGEGSYASIPLSDFSKDFMLEPLIRATAIIVDENDVGTYIDKAANLKAIITNDVFQMNRKFKSPIAFQFKGFMVQCLNELPRIKDRSDSFYRRQLFIPFTKCFTGAERKYIKYDYLHRQDVLEYALFRVLNMNYHTLNEPEACKNALEEYKEFNDPVRQFLNEILKEAKWDLLPFTFLYDMYKIWFSQNAPSGGIQGRNTFITDVVNLTQNGLDGWYCPGKNIKIRTGHSMDGGEPLIETYDLRNWCTPAYKNNDINQYCHPMNTKDMYRGIKRIIPTITGNDIGDEDQNEYD